MSEIWAAMLQWEAQREKGIILRDFCKWDGRPLWSGGGKLKVWVDKYSL
jgi:hypothetical protein